MVTNSRILKIKNKNKNKKTNKQNKQTNKPKPNILKLETNGRQQPMDADRASNSSSKMAEHIGSEISLPRLDVLPTAPPLSLRPPCSLNLKVFHLYT